MTFRYEHHGVVWIDLENPTRDELHEVVRTLDIGERIENELISPSPSPLITTDGEGTLLILHFPTMAEGNGQPRDQEVDFVVGPTFVLTVRYEVVAALHEFRKILETSDTLTGRKHTADSLLEALLLHLLSALRAEAESVNIRLKHIEHEMFTREPRTTIRPISTVNREFLHLEATLSLHEDPLSQFFDELTHRGIFPTPGFAKRTEHILAQRAQVARMVGLMRAVAGELRDTNTDLLNSRQNEIMKVLTIMAFVTFPLSLIAAIFGMNTHYLPIVGSPYDFWIIIGMMICLMLCFFIFFRLKRWI